MDMDQEMSYLTLPDTTSFANANALECLAVFLDVPEAKAKAEPKAKAKGKGKGKGRASHADMLAFPKLRSTGITKHHKGGRKPNPSCDKNRRQLAVPIYREGVLKGMWKIDPLDLLVVTPQANRIYHAFQDLIMDKSTVKVYSTADEIGHPWFPQVPGPVDTFLVSIVVSHTLHFQFWDAVCGNNASMCNLQKAVNKIVISAGFSQEVHLASNTVQFTFDAGKWESATALLRNGVGGGGNSPYQGRPFVVMAGGSA